LRYLLLFLLLPALALAQEPVPTPSVSALVSTAPTEFVNGDPITNIDELQHWCGGTHAGTAVNVNPGARDPITFPSPLPDGTHDCVAYAVVGNQTSDPSNVFQIACAGGICQNPMKPGNPANLSAQ